MGILIVFFRDVLSGALYFFYMLLCIFGIFYVFGISADRKRKAIEEKLKEKKKFDIISGKEAAIAAMESKQVLDVEEEDKDGDIVSTENQNATMNSALNSMSNMPDARDAQKDDTPNVMVLNSGDGSSNNQNSQGTEQANDTTQPKVDQPLVIDTSSIRS